MLLQRLVIDNRESGAGFNYDYMGSAEYEFGATRDARAKLAKLQINGNFTGKRVQFIERNGRHVTKNKPAIDVFVFGSKEYLATVSDSMVISVSKERFDTDKDKIVGWMAVGTDNPILIVRATQENIDRGNKFLQLFIDGILSEEENAQKQEIYQFANGWSLQREYGQIVLPQNDGIAIDAAGLWVLRDDNNNPIDRDKYFDDMLERYQRKIGDPLPTED